MKSIFEQKRFFLLICCLISNISVKADSKPVDVETTNGCKFVYFVDKEKKPSDVQIENIATWNGSCVNGYIEGYGHFELKEKNGSFSFIQNAIYKKGRENGKGNEIRYLDDGRRVEFNGEFFDGHWKNGIISLYKNNELQYKLNGNYINGELNGEGTLTWANGITWTGNFTNGVNNGVGILTRLDGTTDWLGYENGKVPDVGIGDGSRDHFYCAERGLRPGTSYYAKCRNYYAVKMDSQKAMLEYIRQSNEIMREAQDRVDEIERRYRR